MVEATQADRDAADNAILEAAKDIEAGNVGGSEWLAVLFAAHRLGSEARIVAWLRSMPDKIETPTVVPASDSADEDSIGMPEHTVTRVSFHKPSELADAIARRDHAGEG